MRIAFEKLSDDRHVLEIARADGRLERIECETRSLLFHDLLHYAVESEAGLDGGFWGALAKGKTLADLNDRTGAATTLPDWLTEELVERVQERMRRLVGHWKATPFGARMELEWPPARPNSGP